MYSNLRMPTILVGSLLFVIPMIPGFISGSIALNDFLTRYLIGLLVSAIAVTVIWSLIGGYKRANDHAAKLEMARIREEEIMRAREQQRLRQEEMMNNVVESEEQENQEQQEDV